MENNTENYRVVKASNGKYRPQFRATDGNFACYSLPTPYGGIVEYDYRLQAYGHINRDINGAL